MKFRTKTFNLIIVVSMEITLSDSERMTGLISLCCCAWWWWICFLLLSSSSGLKQECVASRFWSLEAWNQQARYFLEDTGRTLHASPGFGQLPCSLALLGLLLLHSSLCLRHQGAFSPFVPDAFQTRNSSLLPTSQMVFPGVLI